MIDWMWADQDKSKVITKPKYLQEFTRSRGDTFKKRCGKEEKYEEGLKEMNMYLVLEKIINSKMVRRNPGRDGINL